MSKRTPAVFWTPQQRKGVIEFLRLYADHLEAEMEDPSKGFGLPGIQQGALHLCDKVLPSGLRYTVNSGPDRNFSEGLTVLLTSEEINEYEAESDDDES